MKRTLSKWFSRTTYPSTFTHQKWFLNTVMIIGGFLIGAGVADGLLAVKQLSVDQLARGLTIFSAGLTVVVLVINTKSQRAAEQTQQETQLQLKRIEQQLQEIYSRIIQDQKEDPTVQR